MLDDGTAVELVLDITDRKQAEAALRDSEARLRSLVEGIPQLVFRSRSSGERLWGSPQWIRYTGQSEAESVGHGWLNAIHPEDRAATMAAWGEAEARGLYAVEHRTFHAAERSWRWFQTRATPVRDAAGQVVEWFGTSTDIDDQVRARELLARSREELEARVAERTAELRTALDSLQAEMAQRERAEAALRQCRRWRRSASSPAASRMTSTICSQGIAGSLEWRAAAPRGRLEEVRATSSRRGSRRPRGRPDPAAARLRSAATAGAEAGGPGCARRRDGRSDPPDGRPGGRAGAAPARRARPGCSATPASWKARCSTSASTPATRCRRAGG